MRIRFSSWLIYLASVATLAAVAWYLASAWVAVRHQAEVLASLRGTAADDGPCAALSLIREMRGPGDPHLKRTLASSQAGFVTEVVGERDERGRRALLSAFSEGLVSQTLCEQIRLSRALGELHPVLALLRYTREGGQPCEDQLGLVQVLAGLRSHKPMMLHALLGAIGKLRCLDPAVAQGVAVAGVQVLLDRPRAMDDLDTLRIAQFLTTHAPVQAAQFACRVEVRGEVSRLANAVGCTPDVKRRLLVHYRTRHPLPAAPGVPQRPEGTEVILLRQSQERCEVMPVQPPVRLYSLPCGTLDLRSSLHVAVRIEPITFGSVRADLVAGLATFDERLGRLTSARGEPDLGTWFGYSLAGEPLGSSETVALHEVAKNLGEEVPADPLRSFCRDAGARYCYDVDWAKVVARIQGQPMIFLSRPLDGVFLPVNSLLPKAAAYRFAKAFAREQRPGSRVRFFRWAEGAELVVESLHGHLELRWRPNPQAAWLAHAFGGSHADEEALGSARLLAALDVQGDGRPELIVQQVKRSQENGELRDRVDEILLYHLDGEGDRFEALNRLAIHEY